MRKAILMMLLGLVSSSAAAEWVELGGNETATTYADPATIRKAGNMVRMWHLLDYTKARGIEAHKPHLSVKMQNEYDCRQERSRTLAISLHSGNMGEGEILGTISAPGNWRPVPPDTLVETLREFACGR
jgi:hypothetical protein